MQLLWKLFETNWWPWKVFEIAELSETDWSKVLRRMYQVWKRICSYIRLGLCKRYTYYTRLKFTICVRSFQKEFFLSIFVNHSSDVTVLDIICQCIFNFHHSKVTILSQKNVPGSSSSHGPELDLQYVPELNLLQQLCRMDDPGIKVEQVDNRVGQGGSQVRRFCFLFLTVHFFRLFRVYRSTKKTET